MSAETTALWSRADEVAAAALACGALSPIPTCLCEPEEGGVRFQLRILAATPPKPAGRPGDNPFLPPDPPLLVADWGSEYRLLLNKFPVVARHLLLVSRQFVPQEAALEEADFVAASALLQQSPGLLFYNGGSAAGASQAHRHLQLIPLPQGAAAGGFPLCAAWRRGALPWRHFRVNGAPADAASRARQWYRDYRRALTALQLVPTTGPLRPYNLLLTESLFALLPRSADQVAGFSVNALGYAGLMLVRNDAAAARLRQYGLWRLLRDSAVSAPVG